MGVTKKRWGVEVKFVLDRVEYATQWIVAAGSPATATQRAINAGVRAMRREKVPGRTHILRVRAFAWPEPDAMRAR